mmetsp:Transcript_25251/g.55155  ORF Transcript_25251/g.55155 Transcript_25251/m.55155 type:complete len:179 (+) Transcript_25251:695-1231(+)|eukprot:CAMPEP_0178476038 /NCGR_PEP_ID=MMETSP0696-20121128/3424_1 /TAXON_ID=265572 /ORGANISM="Extubocellulus spinifer, Strain CCMP396" /LENGTH=178 /DNA_ID=CAMNT_0020103335 /DNA_START=539 /DNA_END=1075 /DNA_ORIENTATION=-
MTRPTLWIAALLVVLTRFERSDAFSFCPPRSSSHHSTSSSAIATSISSAATKRRIRNGGGLSMYLPPETSTQTAPMVSQRILKAPGHTGRSKSIRPIMSNSVLAAKDTLPCFPTAHGLLSPEIVQRMDEMTSVRNQRQSNEVVLFLDTYRNSGPMACLPMLSDPCVLPKLTEAMRDIA